MSEKWLPVPGYEGLYEVSDIGRVRSLKPPRGDGIMKGWQRADGYRSVNLTKDGAKKGHLVYRLVCQAFHGPPPDGTECRHLNGSKSDDSAGNLAWGTRSENMKDRMRHGTHHWGDNLHRRSGEKHHAAKWSDEQIAQLREDAAAGMGARRLARKYGMGHAYAYKLAKGLRRTEGQAPR